MRREGGKEGGRMGSTLLSLQEWERRKDKGRWWRMDGRWGRTEGELWGNAMRVIISVSDEQAFRVISVQWSLRIWQARPLRSRKILLVLLESKVILSGNKESTQGLLRYC